MSATTASAQAKDNTRTNCPPLGYSFRKKVSMIPATLEKNDPKAKRLIYLFSTVVFTAVVILGKVKLDVQLGFDVHIFARINALLNSIIAVLLVAALVAVKRKQYLLHKKLMMVSLGLSVAFLVSYILHHLLAGETRFGGEGTIRTVYLVILLTHIFLAAVVLPFILFTAYRGLTAEFGLHRKLGKIVWPIWFYVAVTGPVVYFLISPYYQ
jgi:putative membrane protein